MPALAGPFRDLLDKRAALASFALRVEGNENQAGSIPDGLPILSQRDHRDTGPMLEFRLDEPAQRRHQFGVFVERGAAAADHLPQRRLMVDAVPVGPNLADEEARRLSRSRRSKMKYTSPAALLASDAACWRSNSPLCISDV
jgi:hypothetical protein